MKAPASPAGPRRKGTVRFVCIHSLTAHGAVGLKPFLSVLGGRCLPVPSVVLSGPGDMPGCERMPTEVGRLLDSTLAALAAGGERAVVVIGYLANAGQAAAIEEILARHASSVEAVVVDPVCGDEGRAYVHPELLSAWPRLLGRACVALPNLTEVELLTGKNGEEALEAWCRRFTDTTTVITGMPSGGEVETRVCAGGDVHRVRTPRRAGRFNGTGDLFAALWVRSAYVEGSSAHAAAAAASGEVGRAIDAAIEAGTRELPLHLHGGFIRS